MTFTWVMAIAVEQDRASTRRRRGHRLRKLRRHLELSQREMGERCGVSQGFIAQVEAGRKTPGLRTALLISKLSQEWPDGPIAPEFWLSEVA